MIEIPSENGTTIEAPVLKNFRPEKFYERLSQMIQCTNEYNGTLPKTWERVEQGRCDPAMEENGHSDSYFPQQDHMRNLVRKILNADIRDVVIEASHAYMYDCMDDPHFRQSMERQYHQANLLSSLLQQHRIAVRRVLFVDNYNPHPATGRLERTLDLDCYLDFAREHGFRPDYLIMESDMALMARELVDYMECRQGLVFEEDDPRDNAEGAPRKLLKRRKVELIKGAGTMSCAALDAVLTTLKFRYMATGVVNILPRRQGTEDFSFNGQQKKVRQILGEHLNLRVLPFFNIFTPEQDDLRPSSGAHFAFRKPPPRQLR